MTNETQTQLNEELTEKVAGADVELIKEMISSGLIYGHKKTKTNPKFKKYIFTTRNGMEIIDVAKTLPLLDEAAEFLKNQIKEGKMVLLVGLQPAVQPIMEAMAKKFNLPYVKNRWIGGLLTNFKSVSGRIEHFKKTQADMEKGAFDKYTKKERVMINKDIAKMREMFGGLETLIRPADVLFTVDASLKGHATAIREAKRISIPVVAIIDSDDDPEIINYPIPANDYAKMSVEWVIQRIITNLKN